MESTFCPCSIPNGLGSGHLDIYSHWPSVSLQIQEQQRLRSRPEEKIQEACLKWIKASRNAASQILQHYSI